MAKITKDQIIEALKEMNMLEIHELIKAIEDTFQVTASIPVAVAQDSSESEEKTTFDVHITEISGGKVPIIKVLKSVLKIPLLEAKKMIDGEKPIIVKEGTSKEDAEDLKAKLVDAGAVVELK